MEDAQIVSLYWARSEDAVRETDAKYGACLMRTAYSILSDRSDSEEAVNDTYLDTWNAIPPEKPDSLKAFLIKITRRISIDILRRRTAAKRGGGEYTAALDELSECVSGADSVDAALRQRQLVRALNEFVGHLPEAEKYLFVRRYFYLEPIAVLAKRLSYTESKTASMLYRIRKKLRATLEKEGLL